MTRILNVIVLHTTPNRPTKSSPLLLPPLHSFFPLLTIKNPNSLSVFSLPRKETKKLTMAAETSFFLIVLLSVSTVSVLGASHHHMAAPAPSVDCSTLILNMADCLSFVSSGSTDAKPEASCCSGLKKVLKSDAECLCEAFKSSASLGVTVNITKASSLPAACKLHAPSIATCGLSVAPSTAPGLAPGAAAGPESAGAIAPNPSLGNGGSSLIPISITTVFTAGLFLLFSCM